MYLEDEDIKEEIGEQLATREDFQGPLDVVPVSDPNIFSEAQRFAQVQAVAQRAAALPQLYDQRAVEERILDTLKIPNPDKLLLPPTTPKEQNAVNENLSASLGRPVVAFPAQDHIAHLKTHLAYMMNPALGQNPLIAPVYLPLMLNHLKEHIALWYVSAVLDLAEDEAGEDVTKTMKELKTPEARQAFDRMLAEASTMVIEQGAQAFDALPPVVAQAQQFLQSMMPPPMQDPRVAIEGQKLQLQTQQLQQDAQMAQAKLQIDQQQTQADMQMEGAKLQLDAQEMQVRMQVELRKQQAEDARKAAELQARLAMNTDDNRTAMELAAAEIASGERVAVSTGTGINPNPNA
jgi:hypothetical protein